jgi:hypothetical protein
VLRNPAPGRVTQLMSVVTGIGLLGCGHSPSRAIVVEPVVFEDRLVIQDTDDKSPLAVPPKALPAPGSCRLWKPGRPLREQSAPGACSTIEPTAPPATWILYRPAQDPRLIHVRVVDPDQAGLVTQVRVYDAERGTYLGSKQRRMTRGS